MKKCVIIFFIITVISISVISMVQSKENVTIPIVRQTNNIQLNGKYSYAYETANAIYVEEDGFRKDPDVQVAQGQYQYQSPEGHIIRVSYTADEAGFQPQGNHLPTAPPVPELILKALLYLTSLSSQNGQ